MKKITIILLLTSSIFYSQNSNCEFDFKNILECSILKSNDFESYLINKGFNFNSEVKGFVCTYNNDNITTITRENVNGYRTITFQTFSKGIYLLNKIQIEKVLDYVNSSFDDNIHTLYFQKDLSRAILLTKTTDEGNLYSIIYQIPLAK
jgi:hypothetical protein